MQIPIKNVNVEREWCGRTGPEHGRGSILPVPLTRKETVQEIHLGLHESHKPSHFVPGKFVFILSHFHPLL